jgi:hypothetical protein
VIFAIALGLGAVWDCLCLTGVVPFGLWTLSFTMVAFGTICVLLPHVFRKADGSSVGRGAAGVAVGEFAAWVITVIACMVYPL